jgi:hypothetical protein
MPSLPTANSVRRALSTLDIRVACSNVPQFVSGFRPRAHPNAISCELSLAASITLMYFYTCYPYFVRMTERELHVIQT